VPAGRVGALLHGRALRGPSLYAASTTGCDGRIEHNGVTRWLASSTCYLSLDYHHFGELTTRHDNRQLPEVLCARLDDCLG